MKTVLPIRIRPFQSSDFNFVLNSWLKSYRNSKLTRGWPNERYYPAQSETIQLLIGTYPTWIICNSEDSNHIYGYVCGIETEVAYIVHYAYMKKPYRRLGLIQGLVKDLAKGKPVSTTHWMPVCHHLKWKGINPS